MTYAETVTNAASLTSGNLVRAIASRTGFVRVYDPTLGSTNLTSYASGWVTAAHSANLPAVTAVTVYSQFDDAAPWYANPTDVNTGVTPSTGPQLGEVVVQLAVPAADVVDAASVQTFHCDPNTLVVVATG